jgi:hypothetical protein
MRAFGRHRARGGVPPEPTSTNHSLRAACVDTAEPLPGTSGRRPRKDLQVAPFGLYSDAGTT